MVFVVEEVQDSDKMVLVCLISLQEALVSYRSNQHAGNELTVRTNQIVVFGEHAEDPRNAVENLLS